MKYTENDKLDILIMWAGRNCSNEDLRQFNSLDTSGVVFDKDFYNKRDKIISKYERRKSVKVFKKVVLRVAVALMALMSLAFMTVMAIDPLREAVFEAVIEWYDDYMSIKFKPSTDGDNSPKPDVPSEDDTNIPNDKDNENTQGGENSGGIIGGTTDGTSNGAGGTVGGDDQTEEVVPPPSFIEEVRKPTYIPDGVIEDVVMSNRTLVCVDYYFENELIYTFEQKVLADVDQMLDSEMAVVDTINVSGNTAYVVRYKNRLGGSIIWTDNQYIYHIYSIAKETNYLVTIAESVAAN